MTRLAKLTTITLMLWSASATAQDAQPVEEAPEPPAESVDEAEVRPALSTDRAELLFAENEGRARTNRIASFVLGGWSVANLSWATVGLVTQPDDRARGFHLSNAAVNVLVAGVAMTTYFSNLPNDWSDATPLGTLEATHATEKLAIVSAALDLAYIATGAFLTAQGNLKENEGMIGVGRSLMLQGAFLCAFDLTTFTFHTLRRSKFLAALGEL